MVERANKLLSGQYGLEPIPSAGIAEQYQAAAERLAPYITDTISIVHEILQAGQRLLCEGAQATLLDLDLGHYPYVTSSSTTVGGALIGLGFGPSSVDQVIGVAKAYCTRVGNGPFPTELNDATGERLRAIGHEYGTTTGRPRRCGWLDMVALRYAVRVNGFTQLVLTKLDVLSGLDQLHIATAYDLETERTTSMPIDTAKMECAVPVYEILPGWQEDISAVRQMADLPQNARRYIRRIEEISGVPISMISVGPEREQAIQVI